MRLRLPSLKWDREVLNEVSQKPILKIKNLLSWRGRAVRLHCIMATDVKDQFHSHPAWAIRIVLWGGYLEQLEDGRYCAWRPGSIGVVSPHYVHRIDALRKGPSYSLWIRGRERFPTFLRGNGWPTYLRNKGV